MPIKTGISVDNLNKNFDLVVFSHLRWKFVYQRPQHLVTRLARYHKVLYVEEPLSVLNGNYGTSNVFEPIENVIVIQPHINSIKDTSTLTGIVSSMASRYLDRPYVIWTYSPAFIDIISSLHSQAIIYDCMDELSAFKGADLSLKIQERQLFQIADMVFTGGKSLYEAKKPHHPETHLFPSSVDHHHFVSALKAETLIPPDIKRLAKPVIGYYGVIDERLDYDLIYEVSRLLPDYSFVFVGPIAKIDQTELPQAKNIHYLGEKHYSQLPGYLKAFDIAMMPFNQGESTRYISPTKTLEFMAARKTIVSTPIPDIQAQYHDVIALGTGAVEFADQINNLLNESTKNRALRLRNEQQFIRATSWDKTAEKMTSLIYQMLEKKYDTGSKDEIDERVAINSRLAYERV